MEQGIALPTCQSNPMTPSPAHDTYLSSSFPFTNTHGVLDCMNWLPSREMFRMFRIESRSLEYKNNETIKYVLTSPVTYLK